ncbi:MAG: hypothetical protein JXB45_00530, partial [Candidatus Krumholzibacteriota bacterium]|nr:hypothetical protein [Candidatus Krumholzibacteriota bacterium]
YGGHLWTTGESWRDGGLASEFATRQQIYPLVVRCQARNAYAVDCSDTFGAQSMTYHDFCVSVLDKIHGLFRSYYLPPVLYKNLDNDAMVYGYRDDSDIFSAMVPGFPRRLELWEVVTRPGHHYDPAVRGFMPVELYDPEFWMRYKSLSSRKCFHPIYRMRARHPRASTNDAVFAFWTTRYAHVIALSPGAVAAPSVHFGLPLWYFNREQVDSIATAIFNKWHIH